VCRNVGSYSRGVSAGSWVSVAIDLESLGARHCFDRGQYPVCKISGAKRTVSGSLGLDVKVRRVRKLLEKPWSPFDAIAESFEIF
jgi:hypothetical protein